MMILDFNSKRNFFSILSMKHDLLTRFVRSHLEMDRILSGFFISVRDLFLLSFHFRAKFFWAFSISLEYIGFDQSRETKDEPNIII